MTRLEELALGLADGLLTEEEVRELGTLLADPAAGQAVGELLDLEHALRRERTIDAVPEVAARIGRLDVVPEVMERVRAAARPRRWPWAAAAAAAVLFLTLQVADPWATLAEGEPGAVVLRDGRELPATAGMALLPGDAVRGQAVVRYGGERTEIVLEAGSEAVFRRVGGAKAIDLRMGEISAEVAPQPRPMRILAPQALAEVLGTRLKLSAVPDATRLEVIEGRVRLTREADGATVDVPAQHYTVAEANTRFVAEPIRPIDDVPTAVVRFSLIQLDAPRAAIPGFEALEDGAVIDLRKLPTRRINLQAHTDPPRVGSLRWAWAGKSSYNTELVWPYTLVPNNGHGKQTWEPKPGLHTFTATPFTGTYGNGRKGEPRTLTLRVIDAD